MSYSQSRLILAFFCLLCVNTTGFADTTASGYFIKPYLGFSSLSDQSGRSTGLGDQNGTVDVTTDSGLVSGLEFGYRYNPKIAAAIAWEYRTNDTQTTLSDGRQFDDGNYASNSFFVNGYYFPSTGSRWSPYVGAG